MDMVIDKKQAPVKDENLNFGNEKKANAFINRNEVKSNHAFMKYDNLMNIPTLKASVNFPDDPPFKNTRPATSESKLDAVVEQLAQKHSRKAIK